MTKSKFCFKHGKHLKNQDSYICVKPEECNVCKVEKSINDEIKKNVSYPKGLSWVADLYDGLDGK